MIRSPLVLTVVLLVSAGCSGKESEPRATGPATAGTTATTGAARTGSAASTPTLSGSPAARKQLAAIAGRSAAASFDATYDFNISTTGGRGSLRIVAMPPSFRVDLTAGPLTRQFYDIAIGTVACAVPVSGGPTCRLAAKPGQPVPEIFNPGVQELFTTGIRGLRDNPEDYIVAGRPDSAPAAGLSGGKCFAVERQTDLRTPKPGAPPVPGEGFETGDYCFDPASGVLMSAKVRSGTLAITKLGPKPDAKDFVPPATPVPLRSASTPPKSSPSS